MADRKKKTGKWKLFFCLAAGSLLTGCKKAEPELVSTARTPYEKLAYDTTEVKKGNLTPEITLKLKAEGLEKITYDATNTELKLDKVYVAVGDKVEKGELLVSFRSDSLEEKMKSIMGTRVQIHRKKNDKGKIEIEYYSKDELERIIDLFESIG